MIAIINGIKVEGTVEEISKLLKEKEIRDLKKATPSKAPEGVHYGVYGEHGWEGDI